MNLWAGQWYSKNELDGVRKYILCENGLPKLFRNRKDCREWIKAKYGFIADRIDLRSEPHGWRMPKAIKVVINETTRL